MNDPKILFVKQFLAILSNNNLNTIPINNNLFKMGVDNMSRYFRENKASFGPYADKIELLFLKYNTKGDYAQFSKAIEGFNGRIVALENPRYIKAYIKLEKPYMKELINNKELEIEPNVMSNIVNCFINGAYI